MPDQRGGSPRAAALARLAIPAALVGIGSAIALIILSVLADRLEDVLWDDLPDALDIGAGSAVWIISVLSVVGLVSGLIVWKVHGHAGPDPATQSLVSAPLTVDVLPGLAVVVIIGLAGGVSLGPENPIVAVNVALAVWLGRRYARGVPVPQWVGFAAAGTIGAMFATPVGAALVLTESPASPDGPGVWDRLFAPIVAAAAGALTMAAFGQPVLVVDVAAYPGADWPDLVSAPVIAIAAALVGVVAVYLFPIAHDAFRALRHPVVMITLGGVLLGVLGAIGGRITLFKGLDEMKALVLQDADAGRLVVIIVIKALALVVAGTCGFRGGRIFPAVFVGVATGLLAVELLPDVPPALAIGAGVLGIMLVISRSGWLSLFMAVTVVGQIDVLPVLCIALLPVWLLVTDRPEMLVEPVIEPARP